jgi:NAD(P)-dependent dehydrogenase (short-subunit alcohol dehydrogenase family)
MQSLPKPELIAISATALALLAAGAYVIIRVRRQPKDKEQRRRLAVNQHGRIGDATITDLNGDTVFYSYSVRGVSYTASQDISKLRDYIPANPEHLIGRSASLKYAPQNPANSILVCEEWSGLRFNPPAGS